MSSRDEVVKLIRARIDNLRVKLLDLGRRNPLLATRFSARSTSYLRVVDEVPDVLYTLLGQGERLRLIALPPLEGDPRDETTRAFQDALSNARLTDPLYLESMQGIDPSSEDALESAQRAERNLRDRLRDHLQMPPRQTSGDVSLPQHARNNHISPSYDLPLPSEEHEDGRHTDTDIQTLLLPDDLERRLNALITKCRTWTQETGINVLHAAFGFLEWTESDSSRSALAPLLLLPIEIEKKKTRGGPEFWVHALAEELETNTVLAEKLRLDFGMKLPKFAGGSIEEYFSAISEDLSPKSLGWKVRRQIAVGVFPSARMAMYHDLDTSSKAFDSHEIVERILVGGAPTGEATPFADVYEVDDPNIEQKVPCLVLDADSSQFSAMVDVADGKNLAVEGPPGTGKSQTIVNAIAASLAQGKKVLFVAEKLAALNVVKSRLEAVGLGEFVLPLQADRATREQVVKSIKSRLDVTVGRGTPEYETRLRRFRDIRAQIKEYIDVIAAPVGQTGWTVHDILGKSLSTGPHLDDKPRILQRPDIPDVEKCDRHKLDALKDAAQNLAAAWCNAANELPHWSGIRIAGIDRFVAEEIARLARIAAQQYERAAEQRARLSQFGIGSTLQEAQLRAIRAILSLLQPLEGSLDPELLGRLCRERSYQLSAFVAVCKGFQEEDTSLRAIVENATDTNWGNRLRQLHQFCQDHALQTLDVNEIRREQESETQLRSKALKIRRCLRPLIQEVPESAEWTLASLRRVKAIVAATPREVLALRNDTLAQPVADGFIQQAAALGSELRRQRDELGALVMLDIPAYELTVHAASLQRAGIMSFASSDYRRARRVYLALSQRPTFDRTAAAEELYRLIQWREQAGRFAADPQMLALFGIHFRGLDTDFEPFLRLVQFYAAIEQDLPGGINRPVRKFLQRADLDLLQSIPDLPAARDEATFNLIEDELIRLEAHLPTLDQAIASLQTLTAGLKRPNDVCVDSLPELATRLDAHARQKVESEQSIELRDLLGATFAGAATPADPLEKHLKVASQIDALADLGAIVLSLLETRRTALASSAIKSALEAEAAAANALADLCKHTGLSAEQLTSHQSSDEIAAQLHAAAADTSGLREHAKLWSAREEFRTLGAGWIVDELLAAGHDLAELPALTEAVIFRALALSVFARHRSVLAKYPGGKLDQLRQQLADLDRQIIQLGRLQLRATVAAAARPPAGNGYGRKSTWTEMALLDNEASKKKRFIPVREMTLRAGRALLELKPCWMMSPLAVAQYLAKGRVDFDLVIIDEASQMPPEDALGALVRGKQVMVVGDTNQLPPTSFFKKMIDDDDADEDETVLEESILDMANAAFRPVRRLRWHYRSRNSALINFSNHHIYDGDLIVFPSADEAASTRSVSLRPVRGHYRSGTNTDEARAMVDATINFMKDHPDRSLGVVVLNQKQRDLLQEELEFALKSEPAASRYMEHWKERNDGLEEFFIKNLENVQGDERDVIFIGTVYGSEAPGGPVMQRFGPINGLAGKRRLNVLFSRAKHKIVTFSSMTGADIKADENGNAGAHMLKRWLEYSATGSLHLGARPPGTPDSDFELFVIQQIRAMGCTPVPQVGVVGYSIDIAVKHPSWPYGYILAVECDGATYHSSKSARDRDHLRQQVLEGLGWCFHRIWSTDWFNDPQAETNRLRQAIVDRLAHLEANAPTPMPTAPAQSDSKWSPNREENAASAVPTTTDRTPIRELADCTTDD